MLQSLKNKLYLYWENVKSFFLRSETILLARIELVVGFITAVIGSLDWSPLLSFADTVTEFNRTQIMTIGAVMFIKGLVTEFARRRNDKALIVDNTKRDKEVAKELKD